MMIIYTKYVLIFFNTSSTSVVRGARGTDIPKPLAETGLKNYNKVFNNNNGDENHSFDAVIAYLIFHFAPGLRKAGMVLKTC